MSGGVPGVPGRDVLFERPPKASVKIGRFRIFPFQERAYLTIGRGIVFQYQVFVPGPFVGEPLPWQAGRRQVGAFHG